MRSTRRSPVLVALFAFLLAANAFAQDSPWDKPNPNSPWDRPNPNSPWDKPDPNRPSTPPQPTASPWTGASVTGNWIADYRDWRDVGDVTRMALIVRPPVALQCAKALNGGCYLIKTPDNTSEWLVNEMSRSDHIARIPRLTQGGMLTMDHPFFFTMEGVQTRIAPAGRDELRGQWSKGDVRDGKPGAVSWRRQVPRITAVKFISGLESETTPGGAPAQVRFAYDEVNWNSRTPVLSPGFTVEVYGDNLWGYHRVHLPTSVDMVASDPEPIHSGPAGDLPTSNVIGFRVTVQILGVRPGSEHDIPKATPGGKTLVIDNVVVPFDLDITGFPGATTPAKLLTLRYVELRDGRYVPVEGELKHGSVFYVEAAFDGPPAERQHVVRLGWGNGQASDVQIVPTSDATVFRSEAIRLQAPAGTP